MTDNIRDVFTSAPHPAALNDRLSLGDDVWGTAFYGSPIEHIKAVNLKDGLPDGTEVVLYDGPEDDRTYHHCIWDATVGRVK